MNKFSLVSIVIVNYNGKAFLNDCFQSLENLDYPADKTEIILVDNGSTDDSILFTKKNYPKIKILSNPINSYTGANNLGIKNAKGKYVAFMNNDVVVDKYWLRELISVLQNNLEYGVAGGKVFFNNGKINTVGIRELENYHFVDEGFDEFDSGQYNEVREVFGISGVAALYRKACLDDIGLFDNSFIIYLEDVDMAIRCQKNNWKSVYVPSSIAYHNYRGTSGPSYVNYYFCCRNRLIYLAKHFPEELPNQIRTSHFCRNEQFYDLWECIQISFYTLLQHHSKERLREVILDLFEELSDIYSTGKVGGLVNQMEAILTKRSLKICFYDHALHLIGGGQKYALTMADVLKEKYDIEFIANKDIDLKYLQNWYGNSSNSFKIKIIKLPIFEKYKMEEINQSIIHSTSFNDFDLVSEESQFYDIFVNVNMLVKVKPLSGISVFLCHFPDTLALDYFYANEHSYFIANSEYTCYWLKERWGKIANAILYPPVDYYSPKLKKENIILSVGRFVSNGAKKQIEMIGQFKKMYDQFPEIMKDWKYYLIGGTSNNNKYFEKAIKELKDRKYPIFIKSNISSNELKNYYAQSKFFWHICGLDQTDPALIEHFGMSTVEAMQNYCVPVVINKGGQREILENGVSGFLVTDLSELQNYTMKLIQDETLLKKLSIQSYERSGNFNINKFRTQLLEIFETLEGRYLLKRNVSIDEIQKRNGNSFKAPEGNLWIKISFKGRLKKLRSSLKIYKSFGAKIRFILKLTLKKLEAIFFVPLKNKADNFISLSQKESVSSAIKIKLFNLKVRHYHPLLKPFLEKRFKKKKISIEAVNNRMLDLIDKYC